MIFCLATDLHKSKWPWAESSEAINESMPLFSYGDILKDSVTAAESGQMWLFIMTKGNSSSLGFYSWREFHCLPGLAHIDKRMQGSIPRRQHSALLHGCSCLKQTHWSSCLILLSSNGTPLYTIYLIIHFKAFNIKSIDFIYLMSLSFYFIAWIGGTIETFINCCNETDKLPTS